MNLKRKIGIASLLLGTSLGTLGQGEAQAGTRNWWGYTFTRAETAAIADYDTGLITSVPYAKYAWFYYRGVATVARNRNACLGVLWSGAATITQWDCRD
jgi:hypothetical protein